jgi:hypothetical protein
MPAAWLTGLSWAVLAVAFASAGWIVYDIYQRGYRQHMPVMEAVWPVTALYWGAAAIAAYRVWAAPGATGGRPSMVTRRPSPATRSPRPASRTAGPGARWATSSPSAIFGLGATAAGLTLGAEYIGDYLAAIALGIVFQYFAIASMRGLSVRKGLIEAAKADVASPTAFEIGLSGWMALMSFVFFPAPRHLHPGGPVYWFLMQIGMIAGCLTAWPVNAWLIRAGIKEAM